MARSALLCCRVRGCIPTRSNCFEKRKKKIKIKSQDNGDISKSCDFFILARYQLIDLREIDRDALNLNAVPIGVNLNHRTGQLQICLLVDSVVNHSDKLPFLQA